jgi:hypothetical protein
VTHTYAALSGSSSWQRLASKPIKPSKQTEIQSETPPNPSDFVHYVLCFYAAKVLEVISRRLLAHVRGEASG